MQKILLCSEAYLSITHFIVLFQLTNIMPIKMYGNVSKTYFITDMLSVLLSYLFIRKNTKLVCIHFILHIFAVLYVLEIYPTNFYNSVYKIAYNHTSNIPLIHICLYNIGTTLDILCHVYNVKYLYKNITYKHNHL